MIVLLGAPLSAAPWPGPVPILARLAAALLAARLLVIGVRGDDEGAGSGIGWPAEARAAPAAAIVGYGSHGLGAPGLGPPEAQAAGFALAALAIAPLITGRDVARIGAGSILLVQAALLVRQGLGPTGSDGEQLVASLLTIGLGGAVAVIASAAHAAGGLGRIDEAEPRTPRTLTGRRRSGRRIGLHEFEPQAVRTGHVETDRAGTEP